jgi:hypothetical protein
MIVAGADLGAEVGDGKLTFVGSLTRTKRVAATREVRGGCCWYMRS